MTTDIKLRQPYHHLQQRVWRWHFYAGVLVLPFAILLSITGTIYLFKPQIMAFNEAHINSMASTKNTDIVMSADHLVERALSDSPGSNFKRFIVAKADDRTVEVEIEHHQQRYLLWLDKYNGEVLYKVAKDRQLISLVKKLHSELLAGNNGSYLVELMASWMIVLIVSGLYLWWPRKCVGNLASAKLMVRCLNILKQGLIPRLSGLPTREKWRNLHGVFGVWFSLFILVFLLSGLPWTQLWGSGFKQVQQAMNWQGPGQEWRVTLQSKPQALAKVNKDDGLSLWQTSSDNNQVTTLTSQYSSPVAKDILLADIVDKVNHNHLVYPIEIHPPKGNNGVWTVRSMSAYRPDRVTIHYDKWSGEELMRIDFSDHHPVKQFVSYGISLHEGALFGWLNQALGVVVALGIIILSASGFWLWWQRRPKGKVAAPRANKAKTLSIGLILTIISLAAFLPMVAISLLVIIVLEWCVSFAKMRWSIYRSA